MPALTIIAFALAIVAIIIWKPGLKFLAIFDRCAFLGVNQLFFAWGFLFLASWGARFYRKRINQKNTLVGW